MTELQPGSQVISKEDAEAIGRALAYLATKKAMDAAQLDGTVRGSVFSEYVERHHEAADALTDADLALLESVAKGGAS